MAEPAVLLPSSRFVDFRAVFEADLRQIEILAGWIVNSERRKRAVAGPLNDFDFRIFLGDAFADRFDILNLDAEINRIPPAVPPFAD